MTNVKLGSTSFNDDQEFKLLLDEQDDEVVVRRATQIFKSQDEEPFVFNLDGV